MNSEHFKVLKLALPGKSIEIVSVTNPKGETFHQDLRDHLKTCSGPLGTEGIEDAFEPDLLPQDIHEKAIPLDHKVAPHLYGLINTRASKKTRKSQTTLVNKLRALLIAHAILQHEKPITAVLRENVAKHVVRFLNRPEVALRIIAAKGKSLERLAMRNQLIYVPNLIASVQKSFESIVPQEQVKSLTPPSELKKTKAQPNGSSRVLSLLRSLERKKESAEASEKNGL